MSKLILSHPQQLLTFILEKDLYLALQKSYLGKVGQTKQHGTRHKSSKLLVISVLKLTQLSIVMA